MLKNKVLTVGILALQGDYEAHRRALKSNLSEKGIEILFIKFPDQLKVLDALIIPGGESSVMLKLLGIDFIREIISFHAQKKIIYGTCAGAILLAKSVKNPVQESLKLIDIDIKRNAYGRQVDSFITNSLTINTNSNYAKLLDSEAEAVFIRAPKITRTGPEVEVLYSHNEAPVLVREKNILISTFHPELSIGAHPIYEILFNMICP